MLKYWILLIALVGNRSYADGSFSSPETIPSTSTITPIYSACNPITGEIITAWSDSGTSYPTYAIYTPTDGWSAAYTITTESTTASGNSISTSCNPTSGEFLATWSDNGSGKPYYSIYTPGTGWGSPAAISNTYASTADAINAYDPTTNRFLVVWIGPMPDQNPIYSFYSSGSWSSASPINASYGGYEVFISVNSTNGQFLATWQDLSYAKPTYSFYTPDVGWSTPEYINIGYTSDINVTSSCNSQTGQYIATWGTYNGMEQFVPYYSFYTDGSWGLPAILSPSALMNGYYYASYDLATNQILASWSDGTFIPDTMIPTYIPTYSFYSPTTGWGTPMPISTESSAYITAFSTFNPYTNMFLVTWADFYTVTHSFYSNPLPNIPPHSFKRPNNRR